MQKLCAQEANVLTYHLQVHKAIGISTYRVMFMVHHSYIHGVETFCIVLLGEAFAMVS